MAPSFEQYDGSRMFLWLSQRTGLPLDQTNFILSQILAMTMALVMRFVLHPSQVTATKRHLFSAVVGLNLVYFCHGRETIHLIILSALCYFILKFASPRIYQRIVLCVAIGYLSCIHLLRIKYHYGSFILDITGPMMLLTQKMTSLAFSLHDGLSRDESQLSAEHKLQAIRRLPTPFEYFSYSFHFQTILCGPLTFYPDYKRFIEGLNYFHSDKTRGLDIRFGDGRIGFIPDPPFIMTVLKKTLWAVVFGTFVLTIWPMYPISTLKDDEFVLHTPLLTQTWVLILTTSVARFKYYHAWLIADAVANASGLGFSGYDYQEDPEWNLISNVHIGKFEFASSFRESMENWNKGTMRWLRYIAYDRAPFQKTIATYTLSSIWHGFYPGYYLTFGSAALVTIAGRNIRRCIRPLFYSSKYLILLYEIITFIVTKICVAYIIFPFLLLELEASLYLYKNMCFYFHVLCLLAIYIVPLLIPPEMSTESQKAQTMGDSISAKESHTENDDSLKMNLHHYRHNGVGNGTSDKKTT